MENPDPLRVGRFEWERLAREHMTPPPRCQSYALVAFVAATYADSDGRRVFPGWERLSAVCGSRSTIQRAFDWVVSEGWYEQVGAHSPVKANEYRLTVPSVLAGHVSPATHETDSAPQSAEAAEQVSAVTPEHGSRTAEHVSRAARQVSPVTHHQNTSPDHRNQTTHQNIAGGSLPPPTPPASPAADAAQADGGPISQADGGPISLDDQRLAHLRRHAYSRLTAAGRDVSPAGLHAQMRRDAERYREPEALALLDRVDLATSLQTYIDAEERS